MLLTVTQDDAVACAVSTLDLCAPGAYTYVYTATDSAGNVGNATRLVLVQSVSQLLFNITLSSSASDQQDADAQAVRGRLQQGGVVQAHMIVLVGLVAVCFGCGVVWLVSMGAAVER
jgi:dienelactone hydrolase